MKSQILFCLTCIFIFASLAVGPVLAQSQWVCQNSGTTTDLYGIYFLNQHRGYVVGDSGAFLSTTNGGASWSKHTLCGCTLRAVQFIDSTTGYVAGYNGSGGVILKTSDGGISWDTTKTYGRPLSLYFMNKDTGLVVGKGRFIVRTTDGGETWQDLAHNHGVSTSRFINDITFINDSTGFLAAGDCSPGFPCPHQIDYLGQICKTTDGGSSWTVIVQSFIPYASIHFLSSSKGYSLATFGGLGFTSDGGYTWQLSTDPTNYFNKGEIMQMDFLSPETGFAVGAPDSTHSAGLIVATIDGGESWTLEDSVSTGRLNNILMVDGKYGWAIGANGSILYNSDVMDVGIERPSRLAKEFKLHQNYPNPFNPTTTITYNLSNNGMVTLDVYDVLGRKVKSLVHEVQGTGKHKVTFDAGNLSSGVYFCQLHFDGRVRTIKMAFIK